MYMLLFICLFVCLLRELADSVCMYTFVVVASSLGVLRELVVSVAVFEALKHDSSLMEGFLMEGFG